ncbi:membrane protein [Ceratobasidium theobromae]|uniref:Membrane protein n=1 Tax=Ceratobasidium theobromae TaxID=1582974 RepID=A0A5N5QQ53_9AGAM|nr:membrane protein [Ceratobasidium theobromae]
METLAPKRNTSSQRRTIDEGATWVLERKFTWPPLYSSDEGVPLAISVMSHAIPNSWATDKAGKSGFVTRHTSAGRDKNPTDPRTKTIPSPPPASSPKLDCTIMSSQLGTPLSTPPIQYQGITADSPAQQRSSYGFGGETITSRETTIEHNEKYGSDIHPQHLERVGSSNELDHVTEFPNKWAKIRYQIREPAAEFLGTMILLLCGTGVNCQVTLSSSTAVSSSPKGNYLSISFGWAVGVALGVWVSGGISGGHINPAVTLSQAIFRGFSWKKVPTYILAQVLGACTGSGLVYANYHRAIDLYEGGQGVRTVPGTASLFATFAMNYMSNAQCFFSELLGTALLIVVVLAITDKRNGHPPSGMVPLALFITILGEGACLGMQTAYGLNPARDLGPRLMCWMAGYGRELWNYRGQYWLYTPLIGPIVGAILGNAVYDAFLYTGSDSIFNKPDAEARSRRIHAPAEAKGKITPSGMDAV